MSDNNDLFPFPGINSSETAKNTKEPDLPAFPTTAEEPPLNNEELRAIRRILADESHSANNIPAPENDLPAMPLPDTTQEPTSTALNMPKESLSRQLIAFWAELTLDEASENELRNQVGTLIESLTDDQIRLKVWAAVNSLLPIKKHLRHGTPEQKLFTLTTLGERFLKMLAGVSFSNRKRLLKTVARYLSEVSETCTFLQMEGEPFNPQYHERAAGSMSSGKTVREMHGFLVTAKSSNQVVKTGLVLT